MRIPLTRAADVLSSLLIASPVVSAPQAKSAGGSVNRVEVISITRQVVCLWVRVHLPDAAAGHRQSFQGEVAVSGVNVPLPGPVPVAVSSRPPGWDAVFMVDLPLDRLPEELLARAGERALRVVLRGTLKGDDASRARVPVPVSAEGVLRLGTGDVYAPATHDPTFFHFDGAQRGIRLRARRDNLLVLPVSALPGDLAVMAGNLLGSGGTLEGRLLGRLVLAAGRGELVLPIDAPGRLELAP